MALYSRAPANALKRPNTIRFNVKYLKKVTPQEVYDAIYHEMDNVSTIKCIAELENGWYNVTFDNEGDCSYIAQYGFYLQETIVQCERTNIQNSAVVYVKAPFEMEDQVVVNALMFYGTVVNLKRQFHTFNNNIETGVRSCMVKHIKKPIPSFLKVGGFSLPARYRGQEKTCKICEKTGHFARDCPTKGRCFICGSYEHRAYWHEREEERDKQQTGETSNRWRSSGRIRSRIRFNS